MVNRCKVEREEVEGQNRVLGERVRLMNIN